MRIKILMDVGGGLTLPINYNHLLTGVIYNFIGESDPEYASFLHEEGYQTGGKRFKLFTFSQLMAERRHIDKSGHIHFGSSLTWFISSPVERFLTHFADTLLNQGRLFFGPHTVPVKDVTVPREPRFRSEMEFRCLSPVVMTTVRQWNGEDAKHYCVPDDPAFSELVRRNLIRKHKAIHGEVPREDTLTFAFDASYIRRKRGRVTRLVNFKDVKIRGVLCPFRVSGSVALIRTGYACGFGDTNSAGFGMAEV